MADPDLQTVVQRMIDAGEPEENIATVIQHYKSQAPPPAVAPKPSDLHRVDTNMIGVNQDWFANQASKLPRPMQYPAAFLGSLAGTALEAFSAPETVATAGAGLAAGRLPSIPEPTMPVSYPAGAGLRGALRSMGSVAEHAPGSGAFGKLAGRTLQKIPEAQTFQDLPLIQQMEQLPVKGPFPERVSVPPWEMPPQTSAFNAQPLAVQMEQLPTTGPTPVRTALPPTMSLMRPAGFNDLPLYQQMEQLPVRGPFPERASAPPWEVPTGSAAAAEPSPAAAQATPSRIQTPPRGTQGQAGVASYEDLKAAAARGEISPNVLKTYEQRYGLQPVASHLPMVAPEAPSARISRFVEQQQGSQELESLLNDIHGGEENVPYVPNGGTQPHPLLQPRVDIGAEKVGRAAGLSKEAVREQTGPILGETPGHASPILPQKVLGRIIDDMRQIPPGPEREAYVARATSGKAQWQVENLRRTLEHLGLLVPIGLSVRNELLNLMRQRGPSDGTSTSPAGSSGIQR